MKRITTILFLLLASIYAQAFTLVIDPGHGGKDAGAIGKNSKEKDINLAVALAFGEMVKANFPDVKVIFTRKTDVFVELSERANIANKAKADLFVSIHTNSLPKGRISRGTETYTLGMHKAAENLEVAKRERTASSPWSRTIRHTMKVLTRQAAKATSYSNSCKTKTWKKV